MKNTQVKMLVRIMLFTATAISLYFVPWILVKAWIMPLPSTVQKQLEEAVDYGFEGMVVYIDKAGEAPPFFMLLAMTIA